MTEYGIFLAILIIDTTFNQAKKRNSQFSQGHGVRIVQSAFSINHCCHAVKRSSVITVLLKSGNSQNRNSVVVRL